MEDDKAVDANLLSPWVSALLQLTQALLPTLTAIAAGAWVAFTYLDQEKEATRQQSVQAEKDNRTRSFEARKPFSDKQLTIYVETSKIIGELVSYDHHTPGWDIAFIRYEELYWTELSMVEDEGVKEAMQDFRPRLLKIKETGGDNINGDLRNSAYRVARALRASIETTWDINLSADTARK